MTCHGSDGNGSGQQQIPRVAGQNYVYLLRQIHDAIEGRRPNFSASHIRLLKGLDYADITGVADYLARIPRRVDRMSPQHLWPAQTRPGMRTYAYIPRSQSCLKSTRSDPNARRQK